MYINPDYISRNIIKYRKLMGISQKELSQKTGINQTTLSDLENYKCIFPKIETLYIIADSLNITVDNIIYENLRVNFDENKGTLNLKKELTFLNFEQLNCILNVILELLNKKNNAYTGEV